MSKNQNGFAILGAILIIVVIGVIGLVGWVVFDVNHPNKTSTSTTIITNEISDRNNKVISQAPIPKDIFDVQNLAGKNTAGWAEFNDKDRLYSFKYPSTWQFRDFGTSKSTQEDSKSTTSNQRITSPNGVSDREYLSWEEMDRQSGGYPGTQILVSESYDPDHPKSTTIDCRKDFYDYFFVKQIVTPNISKSLTKCLFHNSDKYYAYQFNAGAQYFSVRLDFGDKSTQDERRDALQTFISIGESVQYYGQL